MTSCGWRTSSRESPSGYTLINGTIPRNSAKKSPVIFPSFCSNETNCLEPKRESSLFLAMYFNFHFAQFFVNLRSPKHGPPIVQINFQRPPHRNPSHNGETFLCHVPE